MRDLRDLEACIASFPELIKRLEARTQRAGETPGIHNLFVKLKFNDFQQTTMECVDNHLDFNILCKLMCEGFLRKCMPVRLLGIGIKLKQRTNL